ncbi:MAG TPA: hypothetical protein VKU00_11595 [Chthonomonadaceae bacterium]|nr:hypothetical protein [Chthonomonadaceae bacterium]
MHGWTAALALLMLVGVMSAAFAGEPEHGNDWLVVPVKAKAQVREVPARHEVVLENGLLRRTFRIAPNAATVGYDNLITGEAVLRGVKPEAQLQLDGVRYDIGGLKGQPDYAYLLPEWLEKLTADPNAFTFVGMETGKTKERFPWKRKRYSADLPWPPPGVSLTLRFAPPVGKLPGLKVAVHYELYDGIPLLAKWLTVENGTGQPVTLNTLTTEILAVVEASSIVGQPERWELPNIHIDSDYAFNGMEPREANKVAHWVPDPQYDTQVNYERKTPNLLECRPPLGPNLTLTPGQTLETYRVYELLYDSTNKERNGLALRRMYRTLAPWATENPILMHIRQADPASVKRAIDQCADVGFEMAILSFGSGLDMESTDPVYLARLKELADYAHAKGIELGGYSLLASRSIGPDHDVIVPNTVQPNGPIFGNSPCLGSVWGQDYFRKLHAFFETTGMDVLEHDGSYPGDVCAATTHPGHKGLEDSQWTQWVQITDFYKWCRGRGIYLNVPDWYFLNGSTKAPMGYRETNWSLPRAQQLIHGRQNLYDGTWFKAPSMGWMFVPLVEYQGGGAAATLEPLSEHLDAYEQHLVQNFFTGAQACYRGPRLYDTDQTRAMVKKWVDFYKAHRTILDSDVIHLRRADGRDWDGLLHVNPQGKEKGFAALYNPTDQEITRTLRLPLYYTGLTETAHIRERDGKLVTYRLDRQYNVTLTVKIPARGFTWLLIE